MDPRDSLSLGTVGIHVKYEFDNDPELDYKLLEIPQGVTEDTQFIVILDAISRIKGIDFANIPQYTFMYEDTILDLSKSSLHKTTKELGFVWAKGAIVAIRMLLFKPITFQMKPSWDHIYHGNDRFKSVIYSAPLIKNNLYVEFLYIPLKPETVLRFRAGSGIMKDNGISFLQNQVRWEHKKNPYHVKLNEPLKIGESNHIIIRYEGNTLILKINGIKYNEAMSINDWQSSDISTVYFETSNKLDDISKTPSCLIKIGVIRNENPIDSSIITRARDLFHPEKSPRYKELKRAQRAQQRDRSISPQGHPPWRHL